MSRHVEMHRMRMLQEQVSEYIDAARKVAQAEFGKDSPAAADSPDIILRIADLMARLDESMPLDD